MREKLIELLRGFFESVYPEFVYESLVDHLIANGVTVQQWIPVKERLPENHASCIVYRASSFGGHYSMLRYSKALGWHFYDSEWGDVTVDDVTHWMPLPDPPKGE